MDVKVTTVDGKTRVTAKIEEKEYTFYQDERGIHVVCWQGIKVELADLNGKWLIIK